MFQQILSMLFWSITYTCTITEVSEYNDERNFFQFSRLHWWHHRAAYHSSSYLSRSGASLHKEAEQPMEEAWKHPTINLQKSEQSFSKLRVLYLLKLSCAEHFWRNMIVYLILFFLTRMAQIIEIFSHGSHELTFLTWSILWLGMTWWHKEPGHQPMLYWLSSLGIFHHTKG